jgi:hypothetical protein
VFVSIVDDEKVKSGEQASSMPSKMSQLQAFLLPITLTNAGFIPDVRGDGIIVRRVVVVNVVVVVAVGCA